MATEAMMRGLRALDAAPDKVLTRSDLLRALKLTARGRYLVLDRMVEASLVVAVEDMTARPSRLSITFKGIRTLAA